MGRMRRRSGKRIRSSWKERPVRIVHRAAAAGERLYGLVQVAVGRTGRDHTVVTEPGVVAKVLDHRPPLTPAGRDLVDEPVPGTLPDGAGEDTHHVLVELPSRFACHPSTLT